MKGIVPPQTPPPDIKILNHHCVLFNWKNIYDRLPYILPDNDNHCIVELSIKKINNFDEPWQVKYTGSYYECEILTFDQDSSYNVRIRFRNKIGWGIFSDELKFKTPKEPITGDDLHRAIIMDDYQLLIKILETGTLKVNIPDKYDYTPLMACVVRNLEKLLQILIDFGVDINIQNRLGKTALILATSKGNSRIVHILIASGADVKLKDKLGMSALFYAVDNENSTIVRLLLDAGCDPNETDKENNWSPLIRLAVLANNGNPKIGHILIERGADINHQDYLGNTALIHCAFHSSHMELARVLLNFEADIQIRNKSGHDAYQLAKSMNNTGVVTVMEEFLKNSFL